ncbi:MAG: lipopolysaccharide transport periplasmic protein LptA [Tahibacter sp.]
MSTPHSRRSTSPRLVILTAGAVALSLLASSAQALKADREQPLEVSAKNFKTDQNKLLTILTGAVTLSQGSVRGDADKGTVHQDKDNQISRVVLEGKPAHLSEKLDGDGGMMNAHANTIDYDNGTSTAVLTGDAVVVQQNRGEFRGERIVYNTETGEVTGGTQSDTSRVVLRMLPKIKPATAPTDKPATPAATPSTDPKPAADKKK